MKKSLLFLVGASFLFCQAPQKRTSSPQEPVEKQSTKEISSRNISNDDFFTDKRAEKQGNTEPSSAGVEVGYASWYGKELQGRPTASGELFDMNLFTAAHRTYPMGSVILIKNLENGKKQLVKVNDRGPYVEGRIVDVSYATAKALGFAEKGVARVAVELIQKGKDDFLSKARVEDKTDEKNPEEDIDDFEEDVSVEDQGFIFMDGRRPRGYTIQIGAFKRRVNAEKYREEMEDRYNRRTFIATEGKWHYVWIGDFKTAEAARKLMRKLQRDGVQVFYRGKINDSADSGA